MPTLSPNLQPLRPLDIMFLVFLCFALRQYDATRCVAVVYEDFISVVTMSLKQDGSLKDSFVTCYQAGNTREACLRLLGGVP